MSCNNDKIERKPSINTNDIEIYKLLQPNESGIQFKNTIIETEQNNHLVWESIYNGGGVGVGDINNDGLQDIYLSANMGGDKLYLNKGNLQFEDITKSSGISEHDWSSGIVMADVNNDGLLDIYVSKMSWHPDHKDVDIRKNRMYINNGDLTFSEVAEELGIDDSGHTTQSSFFDYNKDGLLDLYVMNAPSHRYDQKLQYRKQDSIPYEFKDHLYLNNQGKFIDVTDAALGDHGHAFGLGLVTQDINQDGWTDIYVANDFEKPDLLLINKKDGTFENQLQQKLKHISYSSMGMDLVDINNDALIDIAVLDMQSNDHIRSKTNMPSMDIDQFWRNVASGYHFQFMTNMLQLNNGKGFYSEIGQYAGLASTDWSWSILCNDWDNDGYKDVLITNGINRNIKDNDFNRLMESNKNKSRTNLLELALKTRIEPVKNFMFKNDAGHLHFSNIGKSWGFDFDGFSYGASYADLDNDGDLDLIVNNNNDYAHLYENTMNHRNAFIRFDLTAHNRTAFGAQVKIEYGENVQYAELHNVRGYQSCSEPLVHFGLSNHSMIDKATITFPSGKSIVQKNLKVNKLYHFDVSEAEELKHSSKKSIVYWNDVSKQTKIQYQHVENKYDDFAHQILRPHVVTADGPFLSIGDVNQDGLEDIFIGASKEDFGLFYLQGNNGEMTYHPNPSIKADSKYEDMGSCLFDFDNDGDLDLYVASGGSENIKKDPLYQDRLYINDGKGNFSKSPMKLPRYNASKVMVIDVNKDGMNDLFVAGKMEGNTYPRPGNSVVLLNKDGILKEDPNFTYQNLGMITDVAAHDLNSDGWQDLILVGEWMHPTILINNQGKLEDKTSKWVKNDLIGWWFDVKIEDLDNDGKVEILLGNIGMNNKFHASNTTPLKIYGDDFDHNNSSDIVLAKETQYGEVPTRGFQCSSEQIPDLKKKFSSYNAFAHANINDIIDINPESTTSYTANEFRSGYLKLKGSQYEFIPFPARAQFSAVQGIIVHDVNRDGKKDITLAGNLFNAEVETTRHDASVGCVLIQGEQDEWQAKGPKDSGFYTPGDVKDMQSITIGGKPGIIVTNNNNRTQTFQLH